MLPGNQLLNHQMSGSSPQRFLYASNLPYNYQPMRIPQNGSAFPVSYPIPNSCVKLHCCSFIQEAGNIYIDFNAAAAAWRGQFFGTSMGFRVANYQILLEGIPSMMSKPLLLSSEQNISTTVESSEQSSPDASNRITQAKEQKTGSDICSPSTLIIPQFNKANTSSINLFNSNEINNNCLIKKGFVTTRYPVTDLIRLLIKLCCYETIEEKDFILSYHELFFLQTFVSRKFKIMFDIE